MSRVRSTSATARGLVEAVPELPGRERNPRLVLPWFTSQPMRSSAPGEASEYPSGFQATQRCRSGAVEGQDLLPVRGPYQRMVPSARAAAASRPSRVTFTAQGGPRTEVIQTWRPRASKR
jgi:hypothetical protein